MVKVDFFFLQYKRNKNTVKLHLSSRLRPACWKIASYFSLKRELHGHINKNFPRVFNDSSVVLALEAQ